MDETDINSSYNKIYKMLIDYQVEVDHLKERIEKLEKENTEIFEHLAEEELKDKPTNECIRLTRPKNPKSQGYPKSCESFYGDEINCYIYKICEIREKPKDSKKEISDIINRAKKKGVYSDVWKFKSKEDKPTIPPHPKDCPINDKDCHGFEYDDDCTGCNSLNVKPKDKPTNRSPFGGIDMGQTLITGTGQIISEKPKDKPTNEISLGEAVKRSKLSVEEYQQKWKDYREKPKDSARLKAPDNLNDWVGIDYHNQEIDRIEERLGGANNSLLQEIERLKSEIKRAFEINQEIMEERVAQQLIIEQVKGFRLDHAEWIFADELKEILEGKV